MGLLEKKGSARASPRAVPRRARERDDHVAVPLDLADEPVTSTCHYAGLRLFENHCFQTLAAAPSTLFVGAQELVSRYACLSEYRPQSRALYARMIGHC